MELIILGIAGVASAFGVTAFSKKKKKEQEAYYQIEKIEILDFIQKILSNRVVFRKINSNVGFLNTHFEATDQGFVLSVMVTKDEIQFYLLSRKNGNRKYCQYVFSRSFGVGQFIEGKQDFMHENEALLQQLEQKIISYNWENPISFYAKKTLELFEPKKPVKKAVPAEKNPVNHEFQQDIQALEELYAEIKKVSDAHFDYEEKHQLDRLIQQDLHRLKASFLSIQEKKPKDLAQMKESLSIIERQLRGFYIKADMHHKQTFERAVEIIKYRNEEN